MKKQIKTRVRMAFFLLAVLAALGITTLALAQSSTFFDLGCWGTFTNGGSVRSSPNFKIQDAVGQMAVGATSSQLSILHSGHVHQFFSTVTTTTPSPSQPLTGNNLTFLSAMFNFIRNPRICQ